MHAPNKVNYFEIPDADERIAYRKLEPISSQEAGFEVVFLGGYASDMTGTKAHALEAFCAQNGLGFLCFDYRGHGASDGDFLDFGIGDWIFDAESLIEAKTRKPVILIGSSMGGWIALKLARDAKFKLKKLITIAAAPDFSEDMFWSSFSDDDKKAIEAGRFVERPSGYEEPYRISPKLIAQGRENLVMRSPLRFSVPVRLFQGMNDQSVSTETAIRLMEHIEAEDLELRLVKNADHSFSTEQNLAAIFEEIKSES